jgi:hypothetical protein
MKFRDSNKNAKLNILSCLIFPDIHLRRTVSEIYEQSDIQQTPLSERKFHVYESNILQKEND